MIVQCVTGHAVGKKTNTSTEVIRIVLASYSSVLELSSAFARYSPRRA